MTSSIQNATGRLRLLGNLERFFWQIDRIGGTNCAVMIEVSGEICEQDLRFALDVQQQRHPLLRVRILASAGIKPAYESAPEHPIPLIKYPEDVKDPHQEIERQLQTPFPSGSAPLMKCLYFRRSSTESTLVFMGHHAIVDGISIYHFCKDIMEHLTGANPLQETDDSKEIYPPVEHLYPSRYTGLSGILRLSWILAEGRIDAMRHGNQVPLPGFDPVRHEPSDIRFITIDINETVTGRFSELISLEDTGLHSALAAAQLLAVNDEYDDSQQNRTMALTSAIDLRNMLTRQIARDDLGVYFSLVRTTHSVSRDNDFWALAHGIRKRLYASINRGDGHLVWKLLGLFRSGEMDEKSLIRLLALAPPSPVLSHIGKLDIMHGDSGIVVRSLSYLVPPLPMVPFIMMSNTTGDRLVANLIYNSANLSTDRAQRIAQRFEDIIRGISCGI